MNSAKKNSSSTPRVGFAILIVALVFMAYRKANKDGIEEASSPVVSQKKSIKTKTQAEPRSVKGKNLNVTAANTAPRAPVPKIQSATPMGKSRQIPKDHVEFELIGNNIAVAFGDVILGRLDSEQKIQRGLFKPQKTKLWLTPIIPFAFREGLSNQKNVEEALRYLSENTPLQFVPLTNENAGIVFEPWEEKKCASYLGAVGGLQPIFMHANCGVREILHEIMHALGFVHEQSRADRDQYILILWDNILGEFTNQFDIVPDSYIHPYVGSVFNFDYMSVMMYRPETFAKPGLKTMQALNNNTIAPVHYGLSARDLERLHYLYGE